MTQHDIAARAPNYVAGLLSLIGLVSLLVIICHAPAQDAADNDKARAHGNETAPSGHQKPAQRTAGSACDSRGAAGLRDY